RGPEPAFPLHGPHVHEPGDVHRTVSQIPCHTISGAGGHRISLIRETPEEDQVVPTTKRLLTITPFFIVDDVVRSAEYYRDVLGFSFDRCWGEPPCFVMVRRGDVEIMLSSAAGPGHVRPNRTKH